jgi:16S rRNA processing protein RimM
VSDPPDWIAVGLVTRAHGVKGEVAVRPLSQVPSRFEPGSTVFRDQDSTKPLRVASMRPDRDRLLVTFEGIGERTAAEGLRGAYLFVPASWAPPLPEGEYWPHQLLGSEVVTESGEGVGLLSEILHTHANDVWVVVDPGGAEALVPALKDVIVSVDLAARRITIRQEPQPPGTERPGTERPGTERPGTERPGTEP